MPRNGTTVCFVMNRGPSDGDARGEARRFDLGVGLPAGRSLASSSSTYSGHEPSGCWWANIASTAAARSGPPLTEVGELAEEVAGGLRPVGRLQLSDKRSDVIAAVSLGAPRHDVVVILGRTFELDRGAPDRKDAAL
jgi:hypothetical protein